MTTPRVNGARPFSPHPHPHRSGDAVSIDKLQTAAIVFFVLVLTGHLAWHSNSHRRDSEDES